MSISRAKGLNSCVPPCHDLDAVTSCRCVKEWLCLNFQGQDVEGEMRELRSFEASGSTHQSTGRNVVEELNLQQHHCENLTCHSDALLQTDD